MTLGNGHARPDLDFRRALEGRRLYGYVAKIEHAKDSGNTAASYHATIAKRVFFGEFRFCVTLLIGYAAPVFGIDHPALEGGNWGEIGIVISYEAFGPYLVN